MALFDTLVSDIAGRFGLGANAAPLVREVLKLVVGTPGGLIGFLDKLQASGLGAEVASWLGSTNPAPLADGQLERVLGQSVFSGIANRLGLVPSVVSAAVGYVLPKLIGALTPGGAIPSSLPEEVTKFLSAPSATAPAPRSESLIVEPAARRETVAPERQRRLSEVPPRPVEIIREEPRKPAPWLWPAIAAAGVVALGGMIYSQQEAPAPETPAVSEATDSQPAPVTPAPNALANAEPPAVAPEASETKTVETPAAETPASETPAETQASETPAETQAAETPAVVSPAPENVAAAAAASAAEMAAAANAKASEALTSLKKGFGAKDLVGVLNLSIINFPTAGFEVPPTEKGLLLSAAARIKQLNPKTVLEVAGHTDNTGDESANLALSQKRAEAVRKALIAAGVRPSALVAKGYGSSKPVEPNDTEEGRFHNRRIEYRVVKS
ncbi:OmpA family protein [Methylocapsa palsarum]|uniref:OmpA-like domain-containing protein n=1 Tax=Methylocapsa palsarum TaxID=1612308 RepID=A0A1I3XIV0_9HYPH|nr:OmpA family protein [Methylocapsa palsarum]SFK19537.1 protein of unknown function [Methylocapsa palsarum]